MTKSEKEILDLIVRNILDEVPVSKIGTQETNFLIEKILVNCGLSIEYADTIVEYVALSIKENNKTTNTDVVVSNEIHKFISTLFEDVKSKSDRLDKVAVRNKQSGAIQLISKKTYQANSQIYTPLSAGWAKANVLMIRNKTSGEEYPVLLKNFDPNKHEKITTATPIEKDKDKSDLDARPFSVQKNKKDKSSKVEPNLAKSKDTSRPMMVEPSLQAKSQTAFVIPRTAEKEPYTGPKFPTDGEPDRPEIKQRIRDKILSRINPSDTKSFKKDFEQDSDKEYYELMGKKNLLPSNFNIDNRFVIPSNLSIDRKIPSAYAPAIERLVNTSGGNFNPVNVYLPNMPLTVKPNAALSLFELLLLFCLTLNDEAFAKFKIQIELFMRKNPEANLTPEIWSAVNSERSIILRYLDKKYDKKFKLIAGSWKVEENLLDLGIDNAEINKEHVSDIFLRIQKDDGNAVLEEFVVSPNPDGILAILNKEKFLEMFSDSKENVKEKMILFMSKIFPIQAIMKNYISVVFPNAMYDYAVLHKIFKTSDIKITDIKLRGKKDNIKMSIIADKKKIDVIEFVNDKDIKIKITPSFESKVKEINSTIYKTI